MNMAPQEELQIQGYHQLVNDQKLLACKIYEKSTEYNSQQLDIQSFESQDGDRRCYPLVAGIFVEATVSEMLRNMKIKIENTAREIDHLYHHYVNKCEEIKAYIPKHNITTFVHVEMTHRFATWGPTVPGM